MINQGDAAISVDNTALLTPALANQIGNLNPFGLLVSKLTTFQCP
jgi:hypothetical protein